MLARLMYKKQYEASQITINMLQNDYRALVAKYETAARRIEELERDRARLEFAMSQLMIVEDAGPQTVRIYDTRGAIDEKMAARGAGTKG